MNTRPRWKLIALVLVAGVFTGAAFYRYCVRVVPQPQAVACTPLPTCDDIAPVVQPQAVVVQSVGVNASYAIPSSVDLPNDATAGHTIIVAIRAGSHSNHGLSVRDTLGDVYTKVGEANLSQDSATLAIFRAQVKTNGHVGVTVSDSNIGATRYSVVEVSGIGLPPRPANVDEDYGAMAAVPSPGVPGEFVFTLISAQVDAAFVAGQGGASISELGKMYTEHGAASATLNPGGVWGAMSVAFAADTTATLPECATPTPTFAWDRVALPEEKVFGSPIVGYRVFVNPTGGTPTLLADIKCETLDEVEICKGADVSIPIQRYSNLTPLFEYEIRVKAYDAAGDESPEFSNVVTWCAPQLCVRPGPCS